MNKKILILQSNYVPWRGYFEMIRQVDLFVVYDHVQYTKNDWRNRNQFIINGKPHWLTVPVTVKNLNQKIIDTQVPNNFWVKKHIKTLNQEYKKAPMYNSFADELNKIYGYFLQDKYLVDINRRLIMCICEYLNIKTEIIWEHKPDFSLNKNERLIDICKSFGGTTYVSGKNAQSYLDLAQFEQNKLEVEWFDYPDFIHYPQLNTIKYYPNMSVLDSILNIGKNIFEHET